MIKTAFLILSLILVLNAAPSTYNILKLPAGTTVTIDANISKWPDAYFVDSLRNNNNVYVLWNDSIWTRADFQMHIFAAYDDNSVYFAVKIISDDVYRPCGGTSYSLGCDNIKINPGGQATAFYLYPTGALARNPSCPWIPETDLKTAANPHGGLSGFPSYEFSIAKGLIGGTMGTFQLSVGTEDEDDSVGNNESFEAVGVEYLGNKKNYSGQWDNQLYYPTFTLSTTIGPEIYKSSVEKRRQISDDNFILNITPNPVNSTALISFANPKNSAAVTITDIRGKNVLQVNNLIGNSIAWNSRNEPNGAYFVKLTSGKDVVTRKICLMR